MTTCDVTFFFLIYMRHNATITLMKSVLWFSISQGHDKKSFPHYCRVPTASHESKLWTFKDLPRTKSAVLGPSWKISQCRYAQNILLKWRNLSIAAVQKIPFHRTNDFCTALDEISKTYLGLLQKPLKLSTFLVPKDSSSKVRTFPGNKDPWEAWLLALLTKDQGPL